MASGGTLAVALAWALLGGLVPLVQPGDLAPGPWDVLLWIGWWTLCMAAPGAIRRQAPTAGLADDGLAVVGASALSFLGFALLVNPFFAVLAAGYPLLVLSWLPAGRSRRARRIGWLLVAPWGIAALAASCLASVSSVFLPEIVPPAEAALAIAFLLWPLAVLVGVLRGRRASQSLACRSAFR
jgi:hypothetical protein